ncbi:MAG: mechanosensitive ion channel family protein [Tissierella sp.]|uniref:mechanosensitive ion channel family protein n=1 Tax=Tissierella sp. TaxID=41274 RepID=UPI003F958B2B
MEQLVNFIEGIQNNDIAFWLIAIAGAILILIGSFGLRTILKRRIKGQRTRLFIDTIINWITLFILIVYSFTYFTKTSFIYKTLFVFGDTQITIILILTILFSVILAVKFSKAVREFVLPVVYDKYGVDRGLRASMNTFFSYFIVSMAVIISLSSIGFNLDSLTVFASVLGVGIGFGLQNVMSNFISGLIILFERPIRVGDRIIVDDKIANVEEIKIRATIVRTRINERMIIPNSFFLEEKFVNRSYSDKKLRIPVEVDVAYGSDVELVEKILYETVYELKEELWPNIVEEPKPRVFFEEFGDSGLKFSVWFWINSQSDEREFRIPSDLRFKIIKKFEENNISIPFPQRDIHIIPKDK